MVYTARPGWDDCFLEMAAVIAKRGSCLRRKVGCVIVDADKRIIGAGYNGAPPGMPQCDEIGCLMIDGHCKRSIHSEANAIIHSDRVRLAGGTIYLYGGSPCYPDALLIATANLVRLVWTAPDVYDPQALQFLNSAGIETDLKDWPETALPAHTFCP